MTKTKLIVILLVFFGLIGILWWGSTVERVADKNKASQTGENNSPSSLATAEKLYNFGRISMKNGLVSKVFAVTNYSTEEISLSKIYTSCMCTAAYVVNEDGSKIGPFGMPGHGGIGSMAGHGNASIEGKIIQPGGSINLEVVYDPNAHGPSGVGMIDRFVYVEDAKGGRLELEIKAIVTP